MVPLHVQFPVVIRTERFLAVQTREAPDLEVDEIHVTAEFVDVAGPATDRTRGHLVVLVLWGGGVRRVVC